MSQTGLRGDAYALEGATGLRYVAIVAGIAVLYVVTGRLGLSFAHFQENATLIWPPTGLSLAALALFGRRVWPGVLIGAAITNAMIGTRMAATLAIAVGNTVEAVLAASLLIRVAHFDSAFARLRDVVAFLVYGVFLSTTVSATVGAGALHLAGAVDAENVGTVWLIWWLGDAGGATVVAPLLLVGLRGRPTWTAMARRGETWGALTVLAVLVTLAFGGGTRGPWKPLLLGLRSSPSSSGLVCAWGRVAPSWGASSRARWPWWGPRPASVPSAARTRAAASSCSGPTYRRWARSR